jgi:hypothetical protein
MSGTENPTQEVGNDCMRLGRRADGMARIPLGIQGEVSNLSGLTTCDPAPTLQMR